MRRSVMTLVVVIMYLTQRTPHSYDLRLCTPDDFAAELCRRGMTRQRPRSITEAERLRAADGGLVVVYHSGAVLLQGPPPAVERLHQMLDDLIVHSQPALWE